DRHRLDEPESGHRGEDHPPSTGAGTTTAALVNAMKLPVTIDPRYHDAVLLDLDGTVGTEVPVFGATVDLSRKLRGIGVAVNGVGGDRGTADKPDPTPLLEAARKLGVSPQRCAIVENSAAGVAAGREGGFALVIGID